jgi:hypothetical protein
MTQPMYMSSQSPGPHVSPVLVVLCSWLIPGGGYFLMGQRSRGVTIGFCIIALFLMGIWIGGIRIMDPPGWGQSGYMTQIVTHPRNDGLSALRRVEPDSPEIEKNPISDPRERLVGPALIADFTTELSDKPWFVGQILCGPLTLAMSAVSVHQARPQRINGHLIDGVTPSHSRSWEIGALYTAIAGMLNLLAMIDATYHAGQPEDPDVAVQL